MNTLITRARPLLVVLALALVAAPAALAKPPATGEGCKPKVSVILKGTLTAVDAGEPDLSIALMVEKANKHGKLLVGQSVTVKVNADTKIRRNGHATLTDFDVDPADRVKVQLRVCKQTVKDADTLDEWTNATTGILATTYAKRVNAHPAEPA